MHDLDEQKLCEFLAHSHTQRNFPFKNGKLKRQVHEMLQSEEEKPIKFYEKLMGHSELNTQVQRFLDSDDESSTSSESEFIGDSSLLPQQQTSSSRLNQQKIDRRSEISLKSSSSSSKFTNLEIFFIYTKLWKLK